MAKSKQIEDLLEGFSQSAFGRSRKDKSHCVTCGSAWVSIDDFRDQLSIKEFGISGMCQVCQDEVFKEPEE